MWGLGKDDIDIYWRDPRSEDAIGCSVGCTGSTQTYEKMVIVMRFIQFVASEPNADTCFSLVVGNKTNQKTWNVLLRSHRTDRRATFGL